MLYTKIVLFLSSFNNTMDYYEPEDTVYLCYEFAPTVQDYIEQFEPFEQFEQFEYLPCEEFYTENVSDNEETETEIDYRTDDDPDYTPPSEQDDYTDEYIDPYADEAVNDLSDSFDYDPNDGGEYIYPGSDYDSE